MRSDFAVLLQYALTRKEVDAQRAILLVAQQPATGTVYSSQDS